jgi:hypothetical protein
MSDVIADVMSDRTGVGPIELSLLAAVAAVTPARGYSRSPKALASIEERAGLGPRYSYEMLLDLARPWVIPVPLVAIGGNAGSPGGDPASAPVYTDCRVSHAGRLVLDAEAGDRPPVPAGLINGTSYRGGTQPPLEPRRVLATLRRLLDEPGLSDREILSALGPPEFVTGCTVTGDLAGLARGKTASLQLTSRITRTDVPVPPDPPPAPEPSRESHERGPRSFAAMSSGPRGIGTVYIPLHHRAHLIMEALPPGVAVPDLIGYIQGREQAPGWAEPHREPSAGVTLPIAGLEDLTEQDQQRIGIRLAPGADPTAVAQQLAGICGVSTEVRAGFPAPLAGLLRSWAGRCGGAGALDEFEAAIRHDRRRHGQ